MQLMILKYLIGYTEERYTHPLVQTDVFCTHKALFLQEIHGVTYFCGA